MVEYIHVSVKSTGGMYMQVSTLKLLDHSFRLGSLANIVMDKGSGGAVLEFLWHSTILQFL